MNFSLPRAYPRKAAERVGHTRRPAHLTTCQEHHLTPHVLSTSPQDALMAIGKDVFSGAYDQDENDARGIGQEGGRGRGHDDASVAMAAAGVAGA